VDAVHPLFVSPENLIWASPYEALPQREVGIKNVRKSDHPSIVEEAKFRASSNMETWTVYILLCADGKPYTGCTRDFEQRLLQHQAGNVKSTQLRLPVSVIL
jgi:hypothetical protein